MSAAAPTQAPSINTTATFTAFADHQRLATGPLADVAVAAKRRSDEAGDAGDNCTLLVFDDRNGRVVDFDLRGTVDEVVERLPTLEAFLFPDPAKTKAEAKADAEPKKRGPGRPKLGVVGREVTLLPRHWDWLNRQPGGASVTLRKLVETARLASRSNEEKVRSRDAAYRFMSAMAGNLEGFEEASRAFFAGDRERFAADSSSWPVDVRTYANRLAEAWFGASSGSPSRERSGRA